MTNPKNFTVEGSLAFPAETCRKFNKFAPIFEKANKAVFKLISFPDEKQQRVQGTGALYEINDKFNCDRFLIMTCHHVLPSNSVIEIIKVKLEFENIEQMKSLTLKKEQMKNIWTNITLDSTVIEISSECANLFKSYGAIFLKVGITIVPKADVAMVQYPQGALSFAYGDIETVDADAHDCVLQNRHSARQ